MILPVIKWSEYCIIPAISVSGKRAHVGSGRADLILSLDAFLGHKFLKSRRITHTFCTSVDIFVVHICGVLFFVWLQQQIIYAVSFLYVFTLHSSIKDCINTVCVFPKNVCLTFFLGRMSTTFPSTFWVFICACQDKKPFCKEPTCSEMSHVHWRTHNIIEVYSSTQDHTLVFFRTVECRLIPHQQRILQIMVKMWLKSLQRSCRRHDHNSRWRSDPAINSSVVLPILLSAPSRRPVVTAVSATHNSTYLPSGSLQWSE